MLSGTKIQMSGAEFLVPDICQIPHKKYLQAWNGIRREPRAYNFVNSLPILKANAPKDAASVRDLSRNIFNLTRLYHVY